MHATWNSRDAKVLIDKAESELAEICKEHARSVTGYGVYAGPNGEMQIRVLCDGEAPPLPAEIAGVKVIVEHRRGGFGLFRSVDDESVDDDE